MNKFWKIFGILAPIASGLLAVGNMVFGNKKQEEAISKAVAKQLQERGL